MSSSEWTTTSSDSSATRTHNVGAAHKECDDHKRGSPFDFDAAQSFGVGRGGGGSESRAGIASTHLGSPEDDHAKRLYSGSTAIPSASRYGAAGVPTAMHGAMENAIHSTSHQEEYRERSSPDRNEESEDPMGERRASSTVDDSVPSFSRPVSVVLWSTAASPVAPGEDPVVESVQAASAAPPFAEDDNDDDGDIGEEGSSRANEEGCASASTPEAFIEPVADTNTYTGAADAQGARKMQQSEMAEALAELDEQPGVASFVACERERRLTDCLPLASARYHRFPLQQIATSPSAPAARNEEKKPTPLTVGSALDAARPGPWNMARNDQWGSRELDHLPAPKPFSRSPASTTRPGPEPVPSSDDIAAKPEESSQPQAQPQLRQHQGNRKALHGGRCTTTSAMRGSRGAAMTVMITDHYTGWDGAVVCSSSPGGVASTFTMESTLAKEVVQGEVAHVGASKLPARDGPAEKECCEAVTPRLVVIKFPHASGPSVCVPRPLYAIVAVVKAVHAFLWFLWYIVLALALCAVLVAVTDSVAVRAGVLEYA